MGPICKIAVIPLAFNALDACRSRYLMSFYRVFFMLKNILIIIYKKLNFKKIILIISFNLYFNSRFLI